MKFENLRYYPDNNFNVRNNLRPVWYSNYLWYCVNIIDINTDDEYYAYEGEVIEYVYDQV